MGGSYSPANRLLIEASTSFVNTRYKGCCPHPPEMAGDIDDGSWHGTFTDLRVAIHYELSEGPVGFAPFVGFVIPTHDYPTMGHSAPGVGLNETWLGFYSAASLNAWIPRTYVELMANYAFVEQIADIAHDRINLALELGYYFNQAVSGRLFATRQWTQGGVDLPIAPSDPLFIHHDQLGAAEFVNVGGGLSWMVNDRMEIFGLYTESIEGTNAHKLEHGLTLGMSYGMGHPRH